MSTAKEIREQELARKRRFSSAWKSIDTQFLEIYSSQLVFEHLLRSSKFNYPP